MTNIRKPRNIDYDQSARLQSKCIANDITLPPGWELYVTKSNRGQARSNSQTCTVPLWATVKDFAGKVAPDFELYYAAHEAAHAWNYHNGDRPDHGPKFYKEFKRLCPANLWHYELSYKKRNAKAAGISANANDNIAAAVGGCPVKERYPLAAGPTDDTMYDDYVNANPKLARALEKRNIPDHDRKSFIRGWSKLDK